MNLRGTVAIDDLPKLRALSKPMREAAARAPSGACVGWGIALRIGRAVLLRKETVTLKLPRTSAQWLVFAHTSDARDVHMYGNVAPKTKTGLGRLGELAANYVVLYADGTEAIIPIRRRHEIGAFQRNWGEDCFGAVAHRKPRPFRAHHEQMNESWGRGETRASGGDGGSWVNWLFAWENPYPRKAIVGLQR